MSLAYHDGGVQFHIFKRTVNARFPKSKINFENWELRTDRNNLPELSHCGQVVADGGCIKTEEDMQKFVDGCCKTVFFN